LRHSHRGSADFKKHLFRVIGDLWAERSCGRCLFLMIERKECARIDRAIEVHLQESLDPRMPPFDMDNQGTFTRREVNRALLATALALVGGRKAIARPSVPLFDFAMAGGHHHGLEAALGRITPGTKFTLVREAANPYDADAVAVHLDGLKLGFIPREANSPVARLLDRGERVTAEVVRMLDIRRSSEVPDALVFTAFARGDPMIRLTAEGPP
jgi:HIRAN domain